MKDIEINIGTNKFNLTFPYIPDNGDTLIYEGKKGFLFIYHLKEHDVFNVINKIYILLNQNLKKFSILTGAELYETKNTRNVLVEKNIFNRKIVFTNHTYIREI